MSREIKFRAWDNAKKEWTLDIMECVSSRTGNIWMEPALKSHKVVIEQYTGLKDKNGKEIYEGDVIQEEIDCGDDDIDGVYRYKVVWDEETLCWSLWPNYGAIYKDLWETNALREVIGNVHENPELLGGEE